MATIAILYGTTEGQTAKIAQYLAGLGRQHGHRADAMHIAELEASFDLSSYEGVIVGASIHEGSHQRYVYRWIEAHRDVLMRVPTAVYAALSVFTKL